MRNNIKKAPTCTVSGRPAVFSAFYVDFYLCPDSVSFKINDTRICEN